MKQKKTKAWKRGFCFFLAAVFLLNICLDTMSGIVYAAGNKEAAVPSIGVTFEEKPLSGGDAVSKGTYLVSNDSEIVMTVRYTPNYTDGYVTGAYIKMVLPYLYKDSDGELVISDKKPDDVPEDQLMGVEANISETALGNWTVENSEGERGADGFRRGVLLIRTYNDTVEVSSQPKSFDITLRFFGKLPENESVSVKLGAGYQYYHDENGNQSSYGYDIEPGAANPDGDDSSLRIINLVNSNLLWKPEISLVKTSVLWDKYNYLVYKVKVSNDSEDKSSMIDRYTLIFSTQSDVTSEGRGGVLEKDMMQWEDTKEGPVKNDDYTDAAREKSFIGVPNQGGALIYDVTDFSEEERSEFDLEDFTNLGEALPYNYSSAGVIGVPISGENGKLYPKSAADGKTKYNYREYYIAVPYPNNFRGSLECVSVFRPTIFFGGRDLAWTKDTGNFTGEFIKKKYELQNRKYVLDDDSNEAKDDKSISIGASDSYYLDGFDNTGNVPVFNAVAKDSLPDKMQLDEISVTLNKTKTASSPQLSDWFKTEPIKLEFLNESDKIVEVSVSELGVSPRESTDASGNVTWQYPLGSAVADFLAQEEHKDWKFNRNINFYLKERIEPGETFDGKIAVTGTMPQLYKYVNKLNTEYEHWYYRLATADNPTDGYEVEGGKKASPQEASLTARRAMPLIETYGVFRKDHKDEAGPVNEAQNVPVNEDASAVRYVLGNSSDSKMWPGKLTVGPLVTVEKDGEVHGLFVHELCFSAVLNEHSEVKEIVLTDQNGRTVTLSSSSLQKSGDDLVLKEETWKKADADFETLTSAEIIFKSFDGSVELAQQAFVDFRGVPNKVGDYSADAVWTTQYNVDDIEDDLAEGTAYLSVLKIEPKVTGTANYQDESGNPLTVPNKAEGWYDFIIENKSKSSAKTSEITVDLSSVGNKKDGADVQVQGFDTGKIIIGKSYEQAASIQRIDLFDWDQDPGKDSPKVSFTLQELKDAYEQADGSLVLPRQAYKEITRLKFIRICCDQFFGETTADQEKDTAFHLQIHGNTDWYDTLNAECSFIPKEKIYTEKDIVSGTAAFYVQRPAQGIYSHVIYDDVKEESTVNDENSDNNRMALAVPYDRDFIFRNEIVNETISVLDDVDTTFQLALSKTDGGFHTTSFCIYPEVIKNYREFSGLKLTDINNKEVFLTYHAKEQTFQNETGKVIGSLQSDGFRLTKEQMESELGMDELTELLMTGTGYQITDPKKQYYVDFCGYEDAALGSSEIQTAKSSNYLDGMRDAQAYEVEAKDDVLTYVSKMYFDTIITAGYNDNETDRKFSKVSTPLEDVRTQHNKSGGSFGDNSELEIGYKALGSFMIDFRQYLNTGSSLPDGASRQEHQTFSYVKPQSLNTAATVNMKVDLPYQSFEAYYLKIDPRAKDYINSITTIRKDGTKEVLEREELKYSAQETNDQGAFCRVNLMKADSDTRFTSKEEDFYRTPESYEKKDPENPVQSVIINLSINQKQSHTEDNTDIANKPDYGTWYLDTDENAKYMFEVSGRYYKMEENPNQNGQVKATATTDLTIGGGRSQERKTSGSSEKSKWSFQDYYYYYVYPYYDSNKTEAPFRSANLKSETYVHVVHDFDRVIKGATTTPGNEYNDKADFGQPNQFLVSFYRNSRYDRYNPDYYYKYQTTGNKNNWYEQDADDWKGKIGYADEVILRDTMPVIRPDSTYQYYGFLAAGLELKPAIAKYLDTMELKLAYVDEAGVRTREKTITVDSSDLKSENGIKTLDFEYAEEDSDSNPVPGTELTEELTDGKLILRPGQFVVGYDIHLKDMMGNGEYNKEVGLKGTPDLNGGSNDTDLIIYGKPYTVKRNDPDADGTNKIQPFTKTDYEEKEYQNIIISEHNNTTYYDTARLMGFLIDFHAGYALDRDADVTPVAITDYEADNETPTNAGFGVKLYNQYNTGDNTGEHQVARVSEAVAKNTFNNYYRLRHIYIPEEFITGDWFRASALNLNINGKAHSVVLEPKLLTVSASKPGCYEIDVEQLIRDNMEQYAVSYANGQTNWETYIKAYVSGFDITFRAVNPTREDSGSVLENGEYLSVDKKNGYAYWYDGIYVDRTEEEFKDNTWTENSTPSFGKNPNTFFHDTEDYYYHRYWSLYNSVTAEFKSVDPNANIYQSTILTNSKKWDYNNVRNLTATMVTNVTRNRIAADGQSEVFAYDNDKNPKSPLEVDKDHLLPYDYVEYTVSFGAEKDSPINLKRPVMNFEVPKGQQLVKWEIISNDTGIPDDKITAVLSGNDGSDKTARPLTDYSLTSNGEPAFYRKLTVTAGETGAEIPKGRTIRLRITTQLTEELKTENSTFESQELDTNIWVTADHSHAYPQYSVEEQSVYGNSSTSKLGQYRTDTDLGGSTKYSRNYKAAEKGGENQIYESRMVNTLKYKDTEAVKVDYKFKDEEYAYDGQKARLLVSGIRNDTLHALDSMTVTLSFLDADGLRGFTLTEKPEISYPKLLADAASKPGIKLEYFCEGADDWTEAEDSASAEFFETVEKIRWTYYEIDAYGTDQKELLFDDVILNGKGKYEDIRPDHSKDSMAEIYNAKIQAQVQHVHHNEETKTVLDSQESVTLDKTADLTETAVYNRDVYRENPQVEFYTQVFDQEDQAEASYKLNKEQKTGYRPNEKMWQKIVLLNQHSAKNGVQTADQGVLLNPVFYDKLPEYLSSEHLESSQFKIRWEDIDGNPKNPDAVLKVEKTRNIREHDYGGWMYYPKSNADTTANKNMKHFSDLKVTEENSKEIDYTVYEMRFQKKDGADVRVEVGDTIEIWYQVQAREDNLPMVYVDEDRDLGTVKDQHPGYFPRNGEYYSYDESVDSNGEAFPFASSGTDGARAITNQNRQMDLDFLLHDIGLSADKNEQVDRWEFLNGSQTRIPGSSQDYSSWRNNYLGNNGVLFDEDINTANYQQNVIYSGDSTNKNTDALPERQTMTNGKNVRDWYQLILAHRTRFGQNWDGMDQNPDQMPVLWSETRLHLNKAWLVGASQFEAGNYQYEATSGDGLTTGFAAHPNYSANKNYYSSDGQDNTYRKLTDDSRITALEYNEDFTIRLHALNYGDWDLDGVEFIYTMPRGIRPKLNAEGQIDGSEVKAQILSTVAGAGKETYTPIEEQDIEVTVLQTPDGADAGYRAPDKEQDPLWNSKVDDTYYAAGENTKDTQPWVLKIVVKKPLTKWFNRGSASGYKIQVEIPGNVYLTNENEHWYDRVTVRPYTAPDSENFYYYQILDYDHWEGAVKDKMRHNQQYGMDYMWYDDWKDAYEYTSGSPNTPYIDGYNIQNNEVQISGSDYMGTVTDNAYTAYGDADKTNLYAQTGTRAVMRKPFVRMWATIGDDVTGNTREDYYTDTEGERNQLNIHVENKYWLDEYAPNAESKYSYQYSKFVHNYEVDGGSRGTLILPVITNILPYGVVPVAKDGTLFSQNNDENAVKELNWTLYQRDLTAGADVKSVIEAPEEKAKYQGVVTYEQVECQDSQGNSTGQTQGRYVVRLIPAADADGSAFEKEARIASQKANIYSIDTFTVSAPEAETDHEGLQSELYKNYQNNRTYVGSKIDGFKYLVDEDIKKSSAETTSFTNPYTVGSYGQFLYNGQIPDARLDAVQKSYTYNKTSYERGNLPDDRLDHTYETNTPLIGALKKYKETDTHQIEDYLSVNNPAVLNDTQKDFNANGQLTYTDWDKTQPLSDQGIMNTLKIRTSVPRLSVEHFAAPDAESLGETQGGSQQEFEYSDSVWYSAKITNSPISDQDYSEKGAVHHSKMVVAFHLPESVQYTGSANWNVENNDQGYMYNNLNDFCLEYYDPVEKKTIMLTQKEMREQGWGVELLNDSSKEWDPASLSRDGQVVTFEITTPKTSGFTDYNSYVAGEKPAGYFPSGSWMNFKIRTRVNQEPETNVMEQPEIWEGYRSQVYATIHDTDGKYALAADGTFAKPDDTGAVTVPAGNYNGYDIKNAEGHAFTEQGQQQCLWNEKQEISDEKDTDDSLIKDYDRDQEYDSNYVTSGSGEIALVKPAASVRLDTSKIRLRVNDPDSDRYIMEDAHVRSAYIMQMRLDQAVNKTAAVNTFIVNYNLPYYGTNEGTSNPADASNGKPMKQTIHKLRSGSWEIPADADVDQESREILEEHLKVYVQVLKKTDPWAETGNYYPGPSDSQEWQTIGKTQGYGLTENAVIDFEKDYKELADSTYQVRWVVKCESFTGEDNTKYSDVQAPVYYPVPAGFRMDIDADGDDSNGKQEMDDIDPERLNRVEAEQNVRDNCAFIELQTAPKNDDDGVNKHTNHFAAAFPQYDDYKFSQTSERARAGFYVDPEVPVVDLTIDTLYFGGSIQKGYQWDSNVIVDTGISKVLKYKVGYESISKEKDPNITQDNVTNPSIAVAVPYVDRLKQEEFQYAEYQIPDADGKYQGDYYLGDLYGNTENGGDKVEHNLDNYTPLWTWYVLNADGSVLMPDELKKDLELKQDPVFVRKAIDMTTNQRTILNFYFEGQLKPGQKLMVEFMVPIEDTDGNAVPTNMLQCKAFGFKKGSFEPHIQPDGSAWNNLGYEYDSNDVNENGSQKDMTITRLSNAITFKSTSSIVQNKTTTTELDSNIDSRAVPVPEGKDYEFKASMINKSSGNSYDELVFYDVLPDTGDYQIKNTDSSTGAKVPRNSKWHGWILPDTIKVVDYQVLPGGSETEEHQVDPSDYEIWVGPMVKQPDGTVRVGDVSDLPTQEELNKKETYDILRSSTAEKSRYFVKLSDIQNLPEGMEKETLVKSIRAVWVQMKDNVSLDANERLKLVFSMHSPLNLPAYPGTVSLSSDETVKDPNLEYNETVAEYSGWNTFVSHWDSDRIENVKAGVYVNAPSGRGYIGSYIWNDADYSGVPDDGEGEYAAEEKTGRIHLKNRTTDLDFDKTKDDPGINGVKVQLLTENGYPCNREGEAVIPEEGHEGHYLLIDEITGQPIQTPSTDHDTVYLHSKHGGPVEFDTESDYYGKDGYYILSNLKPGKYNLKYTFPETYNQYSVTTTELGDTKIPVAVYRDGECVYSGVETGASTVRDLPKDRLVIQTARPVEISAVDEKNFAEYDQKMTSYNVGVGRAYTYGGEVWLDESLVSDGSGGQKIESDGYITPGETPLEDIEVSVYNTKDMSEPCLDGDGNPAVYKTLSDGQYEFRLKPGEEYIIRAKDKSTKETRMLKPTPWTFTNNPLEADSDNDLSKIGKEYETKAFKAEIPFDASGNPVFEDSTEQSFKFNRNIDLGMIHSGRGFLGKFVWEDENYNGIMDASEGGMKDVTVTLESYYYKNNQWYPIPGGSSERTMTTNDAGVYVFDNVMSYYQADGQNYLTGYRMKIDPTVNDKIFKQYGVTHYQANHGVQDSDLDIADGNYYLNDDYIIIAVEADQNSVPENTVSYQGKTYDISDAETILTYDAGFAAYEYSEVEGTIWNDNGSEDHFYNGIMDKDETGLKNVTVYLETYYKKADGTFEKVEKDSAAKRADGTDYEGTQTVKTDDNGGYCFSKVPVFLTIGGEKKLCYYRLRADVPDGYGVTRYQQTAENGALNSDWITNQYAGSENYLTSPDAGDYFLAAQKTDTLKNSPYVLNDGNTSYDIIHKQGDIKEYHGGLLRYPTGDIQGIIWEDRNYDGLRDPGEDVMSGVDVELQSYYYDGSRWKPANEAPITQTSSSTGEYSFENLPTYMEKDGRKYLAGYQLKVNELPSGYGVTLYHQGSDPAKDSDLMAEDLKLVQKGQYLILAKEAVRNQEGNEYPYHSVEVTDSFHDGIVYDFLTGRDISGIDGGMVPYPNGQISGKIWSDANYNGIQDNNETGIEQIKVVLEQYYYVSESSTWEKNPAFSPKDDRTDISGNYQFDDLDTQVTVAGKVYLAGYRLKVDGDSIPDNYGITRYRQGTDRSLDSDLKVDDLFLVRPEEYLIPAGAAEEDTDLDGSRQQLVTVQNADGQSVTYDMLTRADISGQDGGLVAFTEGSIRGLVWEDLNYNGLQDENEAGLTGSTLTLSRFYYDGKTWMKDQGFSDKTTVIRQDGQYEFDGLSTYVQIGSKKYLAGYQLNIDGVLDGYGITRYRQGDDRHKDSDLRADTLSLVRDNEYLITADTATENADGGLYHYTAVGIKDADQNQVVYDMLKSRTYSGQDAGFAPYKKGSITGVIWEDADYDGIREEKEAGYKGLEVVLERYYYDEAAGNWKKDDSFGALTSESDENGRYEFKDLEASIKISGKQCLAGYRLYVEDLPSDRAVTKYWRGEDRGADSNLIASTGSLVRDGEYIPVALVRDEEKPANSSVVDLTDVEGRRVSYDMLTAGVVSGYDGGLSEYDGGSITGVVWEDADYDGIRQEKESGIKDVSVTLERYLLKEGSWEKDETFAEYTVQTGADGSYLFDALDTHCVIDQVKYLYGYRLRTDKDSFPKGSAVTQYRQGERTEADSDLIYETGYLTGEDEYLIPAKKADSESYKDPENIVEGYDVVRGLELSGYDGGLVLFPTGVIRGQVWSDENYDGVQNEKEPGIAGRELTLSRYYYDGKEWKKDSSFQDLKEISRTDGSYEFKELETNVQIDNHVYLAGYQLRVDGVPDGYGITRYRQGDNREKDSDLRADTLSLTRDGEYLVAAGEGTKGEIPDLAQAAVKTADGDEAVYNMLKSRTYSGQDAGFAPYKKGSITGVIWEDADYDGIREEKEAGYKGLEVVLERYYYDEAAGNWKKDDSFGALTSESDENGRYEFKDLEASIKISGKQCLAGYRLYVEDLPSDRAVTKYWRGEDRGADSNLIASTGSLVRDGEYIPVALVKDEEKPANSSVVDLTDVEGRRVSYDMLTAGVVSGYDGGLSEYDGGSITGVVWEDADYDGIRQEKESGIKDVSVTLERYLLKEGSWEKDETFAEYTVQTGADGSYLFDALDTYCVIDGTKYLFGYKVRVELSTIPSGYSVTRYQMGDDSLADSDLIYDSGYLTEKDEYLITAVKADSESVKDPGNVVEGYDIVHGTEIPGCDGGITAHETGSVSGMIWDDQSYDGIRDPKEPGVFGLEVVLERYYYHDSQWKKDDSFRMTAKTNEEGWYHFDDLPTSMRMEWNDSGWEEEKDVLLSYKLKFV
ncbi:Serine-aspartate repeat-containing protein D precursor [uncultured Roseburia sp.]|uniref:SD-repeat containing protein B domain-containing protein n=1 Tax=Brotonthovivens ammoniilytica TaxID=2981725 RepID=A0ABT2TFS6_9FIRM|nr:SdrD B-like domain-containing protein [Brotonthovivens ammoniilytica]MCU6761032.1 hypothetical protein [Brotonthovivens ammoniilytica]SCI16879.1 Serine-aspartate repeat-containing protein D precursor [uncultured Roseburia sp.]